MADALGPLRSAIPAGIEIRAALLAPDARVLADGGSRQQGVVNLATNVLQAIGDGGVLEIRLVERQVGVVAAPGPAGRSFVELSVSDTGHGIDAGHLPRVFEPFFTTRAPGEGSERGLSVVHGIVRSHDGVVTVDSRPGEAATFTVRLPLVDELPMVLASVPPAHPTGHGELNRVVNDEIAITKFEARILERFG